MKDLENTAAVEFKIKTQTQNLDLMNKGNRNDSLSELPATVVGQYPYSPT